MTISHHRNPTSPGSRTLGDRPSQIILQPTQSMADAVARLSVDIGGPVEDVFTQAVVLLMVAVDAQKRGQRLCLADEDLKITGEIVDFGASRDGIGIDPFPVAESDRLDA